MRIPIFSIFAFIVLAAPSGFAQMLMSRPTGFTRFDKDGKFVTATYTYRVPLMPPVSGYLPGQPYSAEELTQQTQILPNGSRVVRTNVSNMYYRDSAGRTRSEPRSALPQTTKQEDVPVIPEIFDPVAGCIYYLDAASRIAHRVDLPQPLKILTPPEGLTFPIAAMMMGPGGNSAAPPEVTSELLGTQFIEGIPATGRRTTRTYAIGTMGNDRPVSTVEETWVSRDLNIVISSRTSNPQQGDRIQTLSGISREEPDAALFQVPKGYRVIVETGPFTITINGTSSAN